MTRSVFCQLLGLLALSLVAQRAAAQRWDLSSCDGLCDPSVAECLGSDLGETGCECLSCRDSLFGDWLGARSTLADHGIVMELPLTQFYQGVASGGVEQTARYGGKLDYLVTLQGAKMGLNEGFSVLMHGETRFGEDSNADAGVLAFPNTNMLYPYPGQQKTALTQFVVMQALSETLAISVGKYNTLDLFNMLYPQTGRGIDGFMNISLIAPPTFFRTTGLSVNGAGVMRLHETQIESAFLVYDTNSTSTTIAPDLFDEGVVLLGYHRFFTEIGGLPGSHGVLGNYSNRRYRSTDPLDWTIIPGEGLVVGEETGSWTLAYILEQTLWTDACAPQRNVKLLSMWSLADGNPNPYRWSGNVQLQAGGLFASRPDDTLGVGWFHDALSGDFKALVDPLPNIELRDVQGVEIYYNAAIRKWLNITGDLQVVENQNVGDAPALILGVRAKIDL